MKLSIFILLIFFSLLVIPRVNSEIYQGIGPLDTLGDVKAKFPKAKFEKLSPAWAKEDDALYSITGVGLPGTIAILFNDGRPSYSEFLNNANLKLLVEQETAEKNKTGHFIIDEDTSDKNSSADASPAEAPAPSTPITQAPTPFTAMYENFKRLANQSDDEALTITASSWVRWAPDTPFPVERLITKYGEPSESGFDDSDFSPYKDWKSRGIHAQLTDDGKNIHFIEFSFTVDEIKKAYKKKGREIPVWLKASEPKDKKKQKNEKK